jgi:hypothetical protein
MELLRSCLLVEPLPSSGCCVVAYFAFVMCHWVHMSQYVICVIIQDGRFCTLNEVYNARHTLKITIVTDFNTSIENHLITGEFILSLRINVLS